MAIELNVPMKINSEKKNSVRYDAINKDAAITSAYVMRGFLPDKIPQTIMIKIEMENE